MAKKEIELLSKNAYAKYLGVNEKAIRKAVIEGKIKKGWDDINQKIIKHLADREYGFLHKVPTKKPGINKVKQAEKISLKSESKSPKTSDENGKSIGRKANVLASPKKTPPKPKEQSENTDGDSEQDQSQNWSDTPYDQLILRVTINEDMPYHEIIRRQAIIDAALQKKKLEEAEDVLIRKERAEKTLYAVGLQLKKSLLALPARIIADIRCSQTDVEAINIMIEGINEVLTDYGNLDKVRLTNK